MSSEVMSAAKHTPGPRFAVVNGSGQFWCRKYSHETGNWTDDADKATTWASERVAEVKRDERRAYYAMTGRPNDAASLEVAAIAKAAGSAS